MDIIKALLQVLAFQVLTTPDLAFFCGSLTKPTREMEKFERQLHILGKGDMFSVTNTNVSLGPNESNL